MNEMNIRIEETLIFFANIIALSIKAISIVLGISTGIGLVIGVGIGSSNPITIGGMVAVTLGILGGLIIGG